MSRLVPNARERLSLERGKALDDERIAEAAEALSDRAREQKRLQENRERLKAQRLARDAELKAKGK
jgi:hypothetical protein